MSLIADGRVAGKVMT